MHLYTCHKHKRALHVSTWQLVASLLKFYFYKFFLSSTNSLATLFLFLIHLFISKPSPFFMHRHLSPKLPHFSSCCHLLVVLATNLISYFLIPALINFWVFGHVTCVGFGLWIWVNFWDWGITDLVNNQVLKSSIC